jgi:hypothetical protein
LANVPIQLFQPSSTTASVVNTKSAEDGSFELIGFPSGAFILVAHSALNAEQEQSFAMPVLATPDGASQEVLLTNRATYRIRGKVATKEAKALPANVKVGVIATPRVDSRIGTSVTTGFQYDAKSGEFEISALPSGFYRLTASDADSQFAGCASVNVVVSNRDVSGVELIVTECI